MEIYTHYYSTYNYNGKRLLVDIDSWARLSMNEQQYSIFATEWQEVIDFYQSLNGYSEEIIFSTVDHPSVTPLNIGYRHFFQNGYVRNPQWNLWHDRFASDPNVEYRSLQIEN